MPQCIYCVRIDVIDRLVERLLEADETPVPGAGADPRSPNDIFMDTALSGNYGADDLGNKHPLDSGKRWSAYPDCHLGYANLPDLDVDFKWQVLDTRHCLVRWKADTEDPYTYAVLQGVDVILICCIDGSVQVFKGRFSGAFPLAVRLGITKYLNACLPHSSGGFVRLLGKKGEPWYWWRFPDKWSRRGGVRLAEFNDGDRFERDGTLHSA